MPTPSPKSSTYLDDRLRPVLSETPMKFFTIDREGQPRKDPRTRYKEALGDLEILFEAGKVCSEATHLRPGCNHAQEWGIPIFGIVCLGTLSLLKLFPGGKYEPKLDHQSWDLASVCTLASVMSRLT